jgi:lipid-binding SYLF domain-containing protein
MRQLMAALLLGALATAPISAALSTSETKRLEDAATVLRELHAAPDQDVPLDLWEKASCVMVVPSLKKAAFIIGGEYGKGLMSCRNNGVWSPPVFMRIGKGSWGLQFGAQTVAAVLLVVNDKGVEKLLRNRESRGAEAIARGRSVDARAATGTARIFLLAHTGFSPASTCRRRHRDDRDDNADLYGAGSLRSRSCFQGACPASRVFIDALKR